MVKLTLNTQIPAGTWGLDNASDTVGVRQNVKMWGGKRQYVTTRFNMYQHIYATTGHAVRGEIRILWLRIAKRASRAIMDKRCAKNGCDARKPLPEFLFVFPEKSVNILYQKMNATNVLGILAS